MTRDEVIKALECCVGKACSECPLDPFFTTYVCKAELIDDLLVLLRDDKQLNAEIISTLKDKPKLGRWIDYPECLAYDGAYSEDHIVCSECHHVWDIIDNETYEFTFCPNCGAKMEVDA